MASRPKGYGYSAEMSDKIDSKWNKDLANEGFDWIRKCLPHENGIPRRVNSAEDVKNALKDGVILCKLANTIKPGSVKKINTQKMPFMQMENIGKFLTACEHIGCEKTDLFQTVDLFEGSNIPSVIAAIHSLGRKARKQPGFKGPTLGPKEAAQNKREFTQEQLRAGNSVIGLQMGSNKGASQAGQNFGKTRSILD